MKSQWGKTCETSISGKEWGETAYSDLQRLYFNKIFRKKEKDNGSGADVVTKRKKISSMMQTKVPQLGKKIYSLN